MIRKRQDVPLPREAGDINLSDAGHVGTRDVEQVIRSWDAWMFACYRICRTGYFIWDRWNVSPLKGVISQARDSSGI